MVQATHILNTSDPVALVGFAMKTANDAWLKADQDRSPETDALMQRFYQLEQMAMTAQAKSLPGAMVHLMLAASAIHELAHCHGVGTEEINQFNWCAYSVLNTLAAISGFHPDALCARWYLPAHMDPHRVVAP